VASTILAIGDDQSTLLTVFSALLPEGLQVSKAAPGAAALRLAMEEDPSLVVLALHPGGAGWKLLRRLVTLIECPLLVLSSDQDRRVCAEALELGADDCMSQPVLAAELVARVRLLLRRGRTRASRREHSFFVDGDLVVDLTRREARCDDEPVALTHTEYEVLACLVRHEGEWITHRQLIAEVWGTSDLASPDALRQHIRHLRQKLEPDPTHPRRLVTRRGEGYQLRRIVSRRPAEVFLSPQVEDVPVERSLVQ
jgi:DNA-binding response OmpR family regulator